MKKFPSTPPEIRFWRFVTKGPVTDCWLWQGVKNNKGYGMFGVGRDARTGKHRNMLAHRFSYQMELGHIPEGKYLCHTCDNPACVNPYHLFVGDQLANMRDRLAKGRHHYGNRTHCSKGHEYTVVGFYKGRTEGGRVCRVCAAERVKRYVTKKNHPHYGEAR